MDTSKKWAEIHLNENKIEDDPKLKDEKKKRTNEPVDVISECASDLLTPATVEGKDHDREEDKKLFIAQAITITCPVKVERSARFCFDRGKMEVSFGVGNIVLQDDRHMNQISPLVPAEANTHLLQK